MKKNLVKEIEIPSGIEIKIENEMVTVKGPEGINRRKFIVGRVDIKMKDNKILISFEKATKNDKKIINTTNAHIKNMIRGVQRKFEYRLKVCFSHFPITVEIGDKEAKIKNFLGEKVPRVMKIPENVSVKLNKEYVEVVSCDKEVA